MFYASSCRDYDRVLVFLNIVDVVVMVEGLEMAEDELDLVTGVTLISLNWFICYAFAAWSLIEFLLHLFLSDPYLDAWLHRAISRIFIFTKNTSSIVSASLAAIFGGEDIWVGVEFVLGGGPDTEVTVVADLREMYIFFDFGGVVHNKNVSSTY